MKRNLDNFADEESSIKKRPFTKEEPPDFEVISIPDDALRFLIFNFIPIYQWVNLELVSKQFRRITFSSYRLLRKLNIYDFYPNKRISNSYNFITPATSRNELSTVNGSVKLDNILLKLQDLSPKLMELRGFDCLVNKVAKKHLEILKNCKCLTSLHFDNCRIDIFHFADFIGDFENLTDLSLAGCNFVVSNSKGDDGNLNQNIINAEFRLENIRNIKGLCSLNLSGVTTLSGRFLSHLNVDSLKILNLRGSRFYSGYVVFDFLENCSQLETLDISPIHTSSDEFKFIKSRNEISSQLFQCLPKLANLRILKFVGYNIRAGGNETELTQALFGCVNLSELVLVDNILVTNSVAQAIFQSCSELQVLRLDVTQLNSLTLCQFVRLQKLKTLGFYSNKDLSWQVNDAVISCLPRLKVLESIYLQRPAISPSKLELFSNVKTLQKIRISGRIITNAVVRHWCSNLGHQLLNLDIPYCENISDGIAIIIANSCKNLQRMNLSYSKITDVGVRKFASECTKLREVDFTQNRTGQITHNSILILLNSCDDMNSVKAKRSVIQNIIKHVGFNRFKLTVQLFCGFTD